MDRKNIQDIYQQVKGDLSALDLRYSVKRVLSHAITGTAHMLGGYAEHLANLARPDSQDEKILPPTLMMMGTAFQNARGTVMIPMMLFIQGHRKYLMVLTMTVTGLWVNHA